MSEERPGRRPLGSSHADELVRATRALELRSSGLSYSQIAEALEINDRTARALVARAAEDRYAQEAAFFRVVSNNRFDRIYATAAAIALDVGTDENGRPRQATADRIAALGRMITATWLQAKLNGAVEQPDGPLHPVGEFGADIAHVLAAIEGYRQGVEDGGLRERERGVIDVEPDG